MKLKDLSDRITKKQLGKGRSLLVTAKDKMPLTSISNEDLTELLNDHGAVIFRNFDVDLEMYSNFIEKNSSKVTCDPARKASTKNSQLIEAGTDAMGLHLENGNLPFLPDAQWFYCGQPAKQGSQSTVCDGVEVWKHLSEKTKDKFLDKKIKYTRNIPEHLWKKYLGVELGIDQEKINETHLYAVNRMVEGQMYTLNEDNSVYSSFTVPAIRKHKDGTEIAFANSILGPSFNYEKPNITFEDGEAISDEVMAEINEVTASLTFDIDWEMNDVVVIDNNTVMHGRRKLDDPSRKIYGGQSYL